MKISLSRSLEQAFCGDKGGYATAGLFLIDYNSKTMPSGPASTSKGG